MDIRVIAMDVDGTLLNSQKCLSEKTKAALLQVQKKGIRLILASGRPTTGLMQLAHELKMDQYEGLLVSFNGAKIVDVKTGDVLLNETMSIEDGQAVLEHVKQFNVKAMIDYGDYLYVNDVFDCFIRHDDTDINIIQYEARGGNFHLYEKEDLAAFANYRLNKILIAGDSDYLKRYAEQIAQPFKKKLNAVFTAPFYFEFTAQGIDKAKALDTIFGQLGYTREMLLAFGDGENDITMLEYAGIGVAMGNAGSTVKMTADEITNSNDEDGIVKMVEKYFFI